MPHTSTFTVFDVETTGLDPLKGDKIIEIAGLKIVNGEIQEQQTFVSLVNPERTIPWEARQVNKISDEAVAEADTIDQVLPAFLEFAEGTTLVAHNARFDMGFLRTEKECCWGFIDLPDCICTMLLSKHVWPSEFRHNLDIVSTRLGLEIPTERHRALPDVIVTAQALLKMIEMSNISDVSKLKIFAKLAHLHNYECSYHCNWQRSSVLRATAKPVQQVNKKVKRLIKDMHDTLASDDVSGVGIAAPQIGESTQVFLATIGGRDDGKLTVFINPKILQASNKEAIDEEGCLSLPGKFGKVSRPISIVLEYLDEHGKTQTRELHDLMRELYSMNMTIYKGYYLLTIYNTAC